MTWLRKEALDGAGYFYTDPYIGLYAKKRTCFTEGMKVKDIDINKKHVKQIQIYNPLQILKHTLTPSKHTTHASYAC